MCWKPKHNDNHLPRHGAVCFECTVRYLCIIRFQDTDFSVVLTNPLLRIHGVSYIHRIGVTGIERAQKIAIVMMMPVGRHVKETMTTKYHLHIPHNCYPKTSLQTQVDSVHASRTWQYASFRSPHPPAFPPSMSPPPCSNPPSAAEATPSHTASPPAASRSLTPRMLRTPSTPSRLPAISHTHTQPPPA